VNRITGFTCSTFDLLHAGHILMLREAKEQCDYLIVGLQTNPAIDRPKTKNKPVQSIVERYVQLQAVKYNIDIIYNSRTHRFSSTELRQRTYQYELDKKA